MFILLIGRIDVAINERDQKQKSEASGHVAKAVVNATPQEPPILGTKKKVSYADVVKCRIEKSERSEKLVPLTLKK